MLAAMDLNALEALKLGLQIRAVVDPWAVGALKMVEHEIWSEKRARNKIIGF